MPTAVSSARATLRPWARRTTSLSSHFIEFATVPIKDSIHRLGQIDMCGIVVKFRPRAWLTGSGRGGADARSAGGGTTGSRSVGERDRMFFQNSWSRLANSALNDNVSELSASEGGAFEWPRQPRIRHFRQHIVRGGSRPLWPGPRRQHPAAASPPTIPTPPPPTSPARAPRALAGTARPSPLSLGRSDDPPLFRNKPDDSVSRKSIFTDFLASATPKGVTVGLLNSNQPECLAPRLAVDFFAADGYRTPGPGRGLGG